MSGTPKNKKEEKTNLKTSSKSTNKKENLSLGENLKKGFNNLKKRWNKAGTGTKSFAVASVLVLVLGLVGFIGFNNANQDADQASASGNTTVLGDGEASIDKQVPNAVAPGEIITEKIYFDNTSSDSAANTSITSSLPNGFTLVDGSTQVCLDPEGTDGDPVCTLPGSGNEVLRIESNTTDGSTNFVDSASGNNIQVNGGVYHEVDGAINGSTSLAFDGADDYLYIDSTDFDFGSEDFTVEVWINPNETTGRSTIISKGNINSVASDMWSLEFSATNPGRVAFFASDHVTPKVISSSAIPTDQWTHVAVSKSSGTTYMFINGVQESTSTTAYEVTNGGLTFIGTGGFDPNSINGSGINRAFNGEMQNVSVVKNEALYTSNFDPSLPSINEVAVWNGNNLTISPSAGLYGNASGATSGDLAVGRVRYLNYPTCIRLSTAQRYYTSNYEANPGPGVSNNLNTIESCDNAPNANWAGGPGYAGGQIHNVDLLGKNYLHISSCNRAYSTTYFSVTGKTTSNGGEGFGPTANNNPVGLEANQANCNMDTSSPWSFVPTHSGSASVDLTSGRYLHLPQCILWNGNTYITVVTETANGGMNPFMSDNPTFTLDCVSAYNQPTAESANTVMDTLDTSNGRGYITFQMQAPTTEGSYTQSASMDGDGFTNQVTDTETIVVTTNPGGYNNCEYGESNYGNNNCPNNGGGSNTTTFADGEVSINKDVPDTVTAGSEVTERIYFDNTASESADSTNITSQLPDGFTLVGGSTKVCLDPEGIDPVCSGDSDEFEAINEGAVWNGGTLSIAPSAGLYGNGSIGTGDLEYGRKTWMTIESTGWANPSYASQCAINTITFKNAKSSSIFADSRGGYYYNTTGACRARFDYPLPGRKYLNFISIAQTSPGYPHGDACGIDRSSLWPSNTPLNEVNNGCQIQGAEELNRKYLNTQRIAFTTGDSNWGCGIDARGFETSDTQQQSANNGSCNNSFTGADVTDTNNAKGYIEFKMKAPSTNGTFNQSASMNSPEFSEVTDSATITVTGGSGGGDTTNDGPNDANIDGTESNNGNDTNNDGLIDGLENITPDGSGGVDGQTATTGQPTACTDLSNTGCVVDAQGNPNSNFNDNDIDGDGIPNSQDTDMDGDGFNNWFDTDTDQDGINNEFDNDDDNDGIPDDQDDTPQGPGSGDNDGDDIPDGIDADIDGDGDNNGNDLDGDGIIDTDSDGNATGCDDLSNQGCVVDDNGNPNSNYTDDDIDGDGIPNDQDNDIDGDGAPNQVDDDADQDGFTNDGSNPNGGSDNNGGNTTDGTPDTNDDNDNLTDIGNDPNQDGADTNGNDPTPQGPTSNDADIDNDNGNGNGGSNNANDGNGDGIIDGLEDSNSDGNGGQTGTPDYTNCQSTAGAATGSTAIGGTNSNPDCVTDNQGNPNDNYTDTDIDGDGIPNQQDTDMDGDGINNQDDNDVDQDGYNNDIDNDDDNDGIPDAQDPTPQGPVNANNANIDGTEANNGNDTNNDGVIDGLENSGSDGQGGIEGQTATNNIPTPCNESQAGCVVDSDGVPNSNYTDNDIDGDGIPNDQDDDMDGDGVLNTVDNDIDQDGYNNEFDLDDDNDGILDTDDDTQSGTTDNIDADVDDDGELNGNDTNNDDIIDGLENSTGDGNGGIANQNPSTGDNMPTACNDAATNPDCIINSDGTPNDNFDESDIDGDNIPNTQDTDLDGDGVPNWLDNDADQDGYNNDNDLDDDNDGIPDDQDDTPQGPGSGNNDGDNQVDGIDADVDDDGANNGNDLDGDGVIDTDANGNPTGCSDASNPDCVVDGDGVPVTDGNGNNNVDPDIDGDGIPNEDDYDMDGDGSPNTDDDDTDQDGFTNDVDLDDDNDGILDVDDPTPQGPVDPTDADIDNDGLNNGNDTNDDGIIDGLEDAISDGNGGVTDQNGNPITPTPCDPTDPVTGNSCVTDENGIPTDQFQDGDIDGDGTPNTSDTDIDGDGVPNNQDNDVDQDGYNNDVDLDDDNDGILDVNDPTPQGPGSGTDGDLGFGDCVLSACILLLRDDATSPGDYYVDPGVELPPVYKDDEDLTFVVNTERTACQDASTITTRRLRVRNNKFAGDDSRWIDITDTTGLQSGEQIRGVITREMRDNNEVGIENVTWSFEIDLVCDGRIYKAQNNYGFAIGALAVVNVSGDVIP
jgi:hypothetical protein